MTSGHTHSDQRYSGDVGSAAIALAFSRDYRQCYPGKVGGGPGVPPNPGRCWNCFRPWPATRADLEASRRARVVPPRLEIAPQQLVHGGRARHGPGPWASATATAWG